MPKPYQRAADTALAAETPGTRTRDAFMEAMSKGEARWIEDCMHNVEMCETEEELELIGQIIAQKSVVIKEACRHVYRQRLIELREDKEKQCQQK